ncbi:unnamed protein product [Scytosiphon promiscuus]
MRTQPRASRVKTLSYERPRRQRERGNAFGKGGSNSGSRSSGDSAATATSCASMEPGDPGGCNRRPPPPKALQSTTAEFTTASFSHDGELLALLDGSPEWTLLWFEWKTGKKMFTVRLDSPVYSRVALSPLDHSKTATGGANGLFAIWSLQQGGKVSSMAPIPGLRKASRDVSYRDLAWLNGDRLVLIAHEGIVILVSPGDVLQEWNLSGAGRIDQALRPSPSVQATPLAGGVGDGVDTVMTDETLSPGECGVSLNVVAVHARGFLVGDSQGKIRVFERDEKAGSGGGGGKDSYTPTRILRIFGADLAEMRSTMGAAYQWLLVGSGDGQIGLVNTNQLFSTVRDGDSLESTVGCGSRNGGGDRPPRQSGGSITTNGCPTGTMEGKNTNAPRLCRGDPAPGTPAGGAVTTASRVALETASASGDGVVSRGFAKAMDAFEDSLRAAADEELGSTAGGPKQQQKQRHLQHAKKGSRTGTAAATAAAASASSASRSPVTGEATELKLLYRPVTRGLGIRRGRPPGMHSKGGCGGRGPRRRGSLTCLAVCARRPYLAAIARGGGGCSASEAGVCQWCRNEGVGGAAEEGLSGSSGDSDVGMPRKKRQRKEEVTPGLGVERGAEGVVEIQIWNYRTKQIVVRHPFGGIDPTGSSSGGDELVGSVIDAGGDKKARGGFDLDDGVGGDAEATCPVAISLHPSGDSIAVAFPHYVNVFFIVGCGSESVTDDDGGAAGYEGAPDAVASRETLSVSLQQTGLADQADAAEAGPMATLRSDQREFFTKGMFSVAGEHEPVVNCDPVSAVHYSPGGHLLAVVTGKVVQVLGVYSSAAGGRLGRVQTLSGHASDVSSFCWGADDRRCWTAADGYIFEWEVGAGMGALGPESTRRGEFVSKRAVFEGIVADPALDGGLMACCVPGGSGSGHGDGVAPSRHVGGSSNSSADSGGVAGDKGRSSGAPADLGPGWTKSRHRSGLGHPAPVAGSHLDEISTDGNGNGGDNKRAAASEAPGVTADGSNRRGRNRDKAGSDINERRRKKQELLASSSTCATAGGTTAPASLLPPQVSLAGGASANLLGSAVAQAGTNECSTGSSNDRDRRRSSIFVWPGKLDAASGAPGLEVWVPHRLTCVRATAFEARFKGAHNVLLAGTKGGLALAMCKRYFCTEQTMVNRDKTKTIENEQQPRHHPCRCACIACR